MTEGGKVQSMPRTRKITEVLHECQWVDGKKNKSRKKLLRQAKLAFAFLQVSMPLKISTDVKSEFSLATCFGYQEISKYASCR